MGRYELYISFRQPAQTGPYGKGCHNQAQGIALGGIFLIVSPLQGLPSTRVPITWGVAPGYYVFALQANPVASPEP